MNKNLASLFDFSKKVIVITGASQGIGKGIALEFAKANGNVVINYQNHTEEANKTLNAIQNLGKKAIAIKADVTNIDEVNMLASKTIDFFGQIDIWINNAGIYPLSSIKDMTIEQWEQTLSINLKSVFLCTKIAAEHMISKKIHGSIINIASIEGSFPAENHSHYNAAKAGTLLFTQSSAREYGKHQIRINAVSPGLIWRDGIDAAWPEGVNKWKASAPLKELGAPTDIAYACLFLASPAAKWITGINMVVDGGASTTPAF